MNQNHTLTGAPPELLPCKRCNAPTPAVHLPNGEGFLAVKDTCAPCRAAIFDAEPLPVQNDHIETTRKECTDCGQNFEAVVAVILGRTVDTVTRCQPCSNKREKVLSPGSVDYVAARKTEWEIICPEFYRTEGIIAALPAAKLAAVKAAVKKGPGCLITGPSGSFKTTAMLHGAVKGKVFHQKKVVYMLAADFKARCSAAAFDHETKQFLKPLIEADFLFLDDLGNMTGTGASEDALHMLLEARMQNTRPVFATTQYNGQQLQKQFKNQLQAEAIIRRLIILTGEPISFK